MSAFVGALHSIRTLLELAMKENSLVPECSRVADNEAAEQPELFIDYNNTVNFFAEHKHDCDEPPIVVEELPDSYATIESNGEQVIEEKNEQAMNQSEDPELEAERILDCTESEMSKKLIVKIYITPRPVEEPSLEPKIKEDEKIFPSQDNSNLPVVNKKAKHLLPQNFMYLTRGKSNFPSQFSRKLTTKKPTKQKTNYWWHVPQVHWKGYYWLLLLLSFCSLINNATGLQEQGSEFNLRTNRHEVFSIISNEGLLIKALRVIHYIDTVKNNQNENLNISNALQLLRNLRLSIREATPEIQYNTADSRRMTAVVTLLNMYMYIKDVTKTATDENTLTEGYGNYTEQTKTKDATRQLYIIAVTSLFFYVYCTCFVTTVVAYDHLNEIIINMKKISQEDESFTHVKCWSKINDCRKYKECQQSDNYEVIILHIFHEIYIILLAPFVPMIHVLQCSSALSMTLLLILLMVVFITRKTHCCKRRLRFLCSNHVLHTRLSLGMKIILCVCVSLMLIPQCGAHDPDVSNVVIENGSKSYECFHEGAITFQWKFNNSTITSFDPGVDTYNHPPYGFLILNPIPLKWNNTRIQCWAKLAGDRSVLVVQEILYVQGVPAPVHIMTHSLKKGTLTISWVPSFKLNLTNDFTSFCVQLHNNATDDIQGIQCGIETHYYSVSSDLKNLSCGDYSVEVIAQNIVGNSAPSSLRIWNEELRVSDIVVTALNNNTGVRMVQLFMVMDICFSHTKLQLGDRRLQTSDDSQFDIFQCFLNEDKMFTAFLEFNTLELHRNSSEIIISTFDLIKTIANLIHEGRYLIKSSFVANSKARGVLYAIMFIDDSDNEDYSRSLYMRGSLEVAMQGIERNIPNGKYRLLSYDIDSNISRHTSPANITSIIVTNSNYKERHNNNGNCTLQPKIKEIKFSCNCSERPLYHVILQNSSTNVIESFTLSCLGPWTIQLEAGQYHIIVFYENATTIMANTSPYYTKVFTVNDTDSNTVTVSEPKANIIVIGISSSISAAFVLVVVVVVIVPIIIVIIVRKTRSCKRSHQGRSYTVNADDNESSSTLTLDAPHDPSNGSQAAQSMEEGTKKNVETIFCENPDVKKIKIENESIGNENEMDPKKKEIENETNPDEEITEIKMDLGQIKYKMDLDEEETSSEVDPNEGETNDEEMQNNMNLDTLNKDHQSSSVDSVNTMDNNLYQKANSMDEDEGQKQDDFS